MASFKFIFSGKDLEDFKGIPRGSTFEKALDFDETFNLSAHSAFAQIRNRAGQTGEPLLNFVTNINGQTLTLSLSPDSTRDIIPATYYFDIELRGGNGEIHTTDPIQIEFKADVTR